MTTTNKLLGEFGLPTGECYQIVTVPGHAREIRRLWVRLDTCEPSDQPKIIARLQELGAAKPC